MELQIKSLVFGYPIFILNLELLEINLKKKFPEYAKLKIKSRVKYIY